MCTSPRERSERGRRERSVHGRMKVVVVFARERLAAWTGARARDGLGRPLLVANVDVDFYRRGIAPARSSCSLLFRWECLLDPSPVVEPCPSTALGKLDYAGQTCRHCGAQGPSPWPRTSRSFRLPPRHWQRACGQYDLASGCAQQTATRCPESWESLEAAWRLQ